MGRGTGRGGALGFCAHGLLLALVCIRSPRGMVSSRSPESLVQVVKARGLGFCIFTKHTSAPRRYGAGSPGTTLRIPAKYSWSPGRILVGQQRVT